MRDHATQGPPFLPCLYRVVQQNFTREIEVFYILLRDPFIFSMTSLKESYRMLPYQVKNPVGPLSATFVKEGDQPLYYLRVRVCVGPHLLEEVFAQPRDDPLVVGLAHHGVRLARARLAVREDAHVVTWKVTCKLYK